MTEESHILGFETDLVQASHGKRLANYFIDAIAFFLLTFIFAIIYYALFPVALDLPESDNPVNNLLEQILWTVVFAIYLGLSETLMKGRTIGKYVTGTKTVNQDGTPISAGTAFARGLIRVIPFEVFSALGSPCFPWHDKWSKTYVIDIRASTLQEG